MSDPGDALSGITQQLQSAISANDRGPVFQLLPSLLQSLPVSPRQRHVPAARGQELLQLGAQALNLSTGNLQAQQSGCQVLRAVSQATIGLQEAESHQAQRQALESIATTLLASQGEAALQSLGVSAMLALVGCDTRPIGPGVYDVNSTDKEGCTILHRLARMGLSICLSALIQSCRTQLDFRHKCHGGQTPEQTAESSQQPTCAALLRKASAFDTMPPVGEPAAAASAAQAASLVLDPRTMFPPPQYQRPPSRSEQQQQLRQQQLQQQQQQQAGAAMPGLFPLLANMQGQTSAMLHLTTQPSHLYGGGFSSMLPALSAPTSHLLPVRPNPPNDAASMAASQRASMESATTNTTTNTRPSSDDASMLSRLYPSSSLESSFSHTRMSIDDLQQRISSGSSRSSTWSPYHPLNAPQSGVQAQHSSPWPSRLARAFSEDPSMASDRLSRESHRMSIEDRSSMEEAHSTVSMSGHYVTGTIAEEEQEDIADLDKQGAGPNWADAAAAAAAGPDWSQVSAAMGPGGAAAGEGSEAGQNLNWPWLIGQLASEHGPMDPNALLDDESEGVSKHLWLGNLNTRLPRAVLKAVFEVHGPVDDVVTFPGRMYAFVNFQHADDAARAQEALDGKDVAPLSGGRRLTVRFRPSKRALGKLNEGHPDAHDSPAVPQLRDFEGQHVEPALLHGSRGGEWEGSSTPSNRVWLGNISATATLRSVRSVFSKFGPLTDAAVFPARIGPLGYAFVNFERVSDAAGAYQALNNVVLPALTGCKQLKMRFKPAKGNSAELLRGNSQSLEADWEGSLLEASQPSRHLLLGNISSRPNESALETVFGKFGPLDSVKVFPGKTYALVSFKDLAPAAEAMQCLDGHSLLSVSGQKPLVLRYQSGTAMQPSGTAAAEAHDTSAAASPLRRPPQGEASDPTAKPGAGGAGTPRPARSPAGGDEDESDDDSLMPAVNLSNRLNPNNVHFDRQLAAQYKRMSKHEKEALWAADRARQHQLRELTELSQMAGLNATELSQLTELTQAAMLSQPGDLSSGLLTQLGNYFQKPPTPAVPGLAPSQPWEGSVPPGGAFPGGRNSLGAAGINGAALTGAASGLQAAAQSLLRQRMEALRQQGVGLRGAFTPGPPGLGQWEGQHPQQQQLPFMVYPTPSQPTANWPPSAPGVGRPAPTSLPQHMMRNPYQPPIGPSSHMRPPGNQPGTFPGFQQQQGLGLHFQAQQQPQPQDVQAQLQQALDNQARYSVEQQRHQLRRQAIDQTHPNNEPADPQSRTAAASGYGGGHDNPAWSRSDPVRRAEQHRQLAEMLAGSSLHQHDHGLSQHSNTYGGSQASHDHMHRLTSLGNSSYDQAHRLTSLGAVSSPEQPYRLTSMGQMGGNEHAYRLSSLGTASSADAMAAFRDSTSHSAQHPSGPIPEDTSLPEGARLSQMHDWGRQM